jgi:hypothetical protein
MAIQGVAMVRLKKTKKEIISKAKKLAVAHEAKFKGCGQCTFLAIVDALRWGGIELITEDVEKRLFPSISMLTAGVCMTGEGTCGAVSSSAMALGLAMGVPIDSADVEAARQAAATVRDTLLKKYFRKYGSILCKDVQRKFFGKAWDLTDDEMAHEFLGITRGCAIIETAQWTTGIILDELEKKKSGKKPIPGNK